MPHPKLISIWQLRHRSYGTIYARLESGDLTSHFPSREAADADRQRFNVPNDFEVIEVRQDRGESS
jgi:hypothetical protein